MLNYVNVFNQADASSCIIYWVDFQFDNSAKGKLRKSFLLPVAALFVATIFRSAGAALPGSKSAVPIHKLKSYEVGGNFPAVDPENYWTDFSVQKNPDAYPILGFATAPGIPTLAFTQSEVLVYNKGSWNVLDDVERADIACVASDGRFVVIGEDPWSQGIGLTLPMMVVAEISESGGTCHLTDIRSFRIPIGHQLNDVKFVGRGRAIGLSLLEYVTFSVGFDRSGNISARFSPHPFGPGIVSYGGTLFGSSCETSRYLLYTNNIGGIGRLGDGLLRFDPIFNAYAEDSKGFEMDETINSGTLVDSNAALFLTDRKLYVCTRQKSGMFKATSVKDLGTNSGENVPCSDLARILALNDGTVYAVTTSGLLLSTRFDPSQRRLRRWEVRANLPVFDVTGGFCKLDRNTLLIGGNSIVQYNIDGDNLSSQRVTLGSHPSERFTAQIFPASTTYGIGIGRLNNSESRQYVYLVQVFGPNKLFEDKDGAEFPQSNEDLAPERGATGVSGNSGILPNKYNIAVAIGDLNEDGSEDIIVSRLNGPPIVLMNNGEGYFRNEARRMGLDTNLKRSECVTLADVNNDGWLDLFATSFIGSNRLFMNEGGGKFKDVTDMSGLESNGKSIVAVFGDLNGDGYPDLYVGNWNRKNDLYINSGNGTFRNVTAMSGTGCGDLHETNSVLLADFNNDGKLDIFVGNREGGNRLFLNRGNDHFEDVTKESGLADTMATYGAVFGDFEDDGRLDLIVAGILHAKYYKNVGNDSNGVPIFKDETAKFLPSPNYFNGYNTGAATFDAEENGDLDAIIGQYQGHTVFLENNRNELPGVHKNFIEVNVQGVKSNYDAIGATVRLLKNGKQVAYRQIMSTYGYASSSSKTQLFGITDTSAHYQIEVDFPVTGIRKVVNAVPGTIIDIKEMDGISAGLVTLRKSLETFLDGRWFYDAFLLLLSFSLTLLSVLSLKIPVIMKHSGRIGWSTRLRVFAVSFAACIAALIVAHVFYRLISGPSVYISGSGNPFIELILPAVLGYVVSGYSVKAIDTKKFRETLRQEVFIRLNIVLRKFSHGEGSLSNLNSLAFFFRNIDAVIVQAVSRGDRSDPSVKQPGMDMALSRFRLAINEYRQKTEPELEEIGTLFELAGEINAKLASQHSGSNASQLIRTECATLSKLLSKTEIAFGKAFSGSENSRIHSLTGELAESIERVEKIVSSVANEFDKTHTCNVSEAVASEVAKYKSRFLESSPSLEISADVPESNDGALIGIISDDDLRQVLEILLQNSIESLSTMKGAGKKRITLRLFGNDSTLELAVEDNGTGISRDAAARMFDKGFSTKVGKRGIGLALARDVIRMYGGDLKFDPTFSGGVRFIAVIPKALDSVI